MKANIATPIVEQSFQSVINLRPIAYHLLQYIINQAEMRNVPESEILAECIEYHKEHAGV